jgi:putative ABC transport system permease protein
MLAMIAANMLRRRGRTALTALGVAVGVMTVVALLSVTGGLSRSAGDLAKLGRADFGVFQGGLSDLTASSLPDSIVSRVAAQPGVATAVPIQIVPHAIARDSSILVFGANPNGILGRRLVLISGRLPRGQQLLVGVGAAKQLHAAVGGTITVSGRPFPVAGIYRSGISLEDNGVVLPLSVTQHISGRSGAISMIAVSVAPGYRDVDVERRIERAIPGTLSLGDPSEVARVDTNSRVITKAAIIIAVLALLLGAVVVVNTMAMSVIERRQQFGLLAVVGWSRVRVASLILGEAIAVSFVGAAAGLALGALASELVVRALAAGTFVSPAVTTWVLARGLLVGLALGVIGALFSVWRVMQGPTLRAISS